LIFRGEQIERLMGGMGRKLGMLDAWPELWEWKMTLFNEEI